MSFSPPFRVDDSYSYWLRCWYRGSRKWVTAPILDAEGRAVVFLSGPADSNYPVGPPGAEVMLGPVYRIGREVAKNMTAGRSPRESMKAARKAIPGTCVKISKQVIDG